MTGQPNSSEAVIGADAGVTTLINVFTVDPSRQQELVELWQQATEDVMRNLPGFITASIHRSFDGTSVINYAQWESREAFAAMFEDRRASAQLTKLAEIGTPDPVICEVVSVHHADAQRRSS